MSEQTSTTGGSTLTELPLSDSGQQQAPAYAQQPASPYETHPPAWTPMAAQPGAAGAPPAAPKQRFLDRVTKLWHVLAVGVACLVVGLGVGVLVGNQTAGSGSGTGQTPTFGNGQGPGGQGGQGGFGQGGPGMQGQSGQQGQQSQQGQSSQSGGLSQDGAGTLS